MRIDRIGFWLRDQYEGVDAQIEATKREIPVYGAKCSRLGILLAGLVLSASYSSVPASVQSAKQRFVVRLTAKTVVVTPPEALVTDVESDSAEFAEQTWTLESNSTTGLVAEFSVNDPFSNSSNPAENEVA